MQRTTPRPASFFRAALLLVALPLLPFVSFVHAEPAPAPPSAPEAKRLLLVTVTTGYRHAAQPDIPAPQKTDAPGSPARARFEQAVREALAPLALDRLRAERIDGVVFASTSGDLPLPDREGFLAWIADGHAFIGMHAATDTLANHADYCEMIGGAFDGHPWHEQVTLRVETPGHPAVGDYREPFVIKDEIYQFKGWSRDNVTVLLSLDPSNAERPAPPGKPAFFARGKRADHDYALAWVRRSGQGRVFYTALGHGDETWNDARFQSHLRGGILWSLGLASAAP